MAKFDENTKQLFINFFVLGMAVSALIMLALLLLWPKVPPICVTLFTEQTVKDPAWAREYWEGVAKLVEEKRNHD